MGNDLPDYQSQWVSATVEATSFRSGLDADKPASPAAGDIWLARDTAILYVCNVAGAWTNVGSLYLPLAGGEMTGQTLGRSVDNDIFVICGGLAATGASPLLALYGVDHAVVPSRFVIYVANAAKTGRVEAFHCDGITDTPVLDMSSHKISSLAAPTADADAARKLDVDTVNAKLDDVTQTNATASRALATSYQNTSGKIRIITITAYAGGAGTALLAKCDTNATPVLVVARAVVNATGASLTFVVPPNYYYRAEGGTDVALSIWMEWDLH